jgi:undecaprenyl-phosphate 4-deoxy-4-formamido-L-arabinose transferase
MGYSSIMAIQLFSSGVIMLILGMIGEYLGRIYISLNSSPQYVVRETLNTEQEEQVKNT